LIFYANTLLLKLQQQLANRWSKVQMAKFSLMVSYVTTVIVYGFAVYLFFTSAEYNLWALAWSYLAVCAGMSGVAFLMMGLDKWLAKGNSSRRQRNAAEAWRTPEAALHGLEIAGGWLGSFAAQRVFWHKVSKQVYQLQFWSAVVLHVLLVAAVATGAAGQIYIAVGVAALAVVQLIIVYLMAARQKKLSREAY